MSSDTTTATLEVGHEAPDFELRDNEGQTFRLTELRGKKNVLLVFYPFAFSPGCENEFCTLRDTNADLVSDEDVEVVGISVDPVWSIRAWKEQQRFPNRFVSDFWPHGAVARMYGAFDDTLGFAHRHTFLIDKQGIVRHIERNHAKDRRDQSVWRDKLAELR